MDYLKEAENELNDYNDLINALDCLKDEIKIIEYELKSVKTLNYESVPARGNINGDYRIANLIFKKQVKTDAYKLTLAKVRHIDKALKSLEQNGEHNCIDAILLKNLYLSKYRSQQICEKLSISERTFHRRKYLALRRFARLLFGLKVD